MTGRATDNRLGALALAVTDRTSEAVTGAATQSDTVAAALSALHHILDGPSIDRLRQVLGLTHSGAVRLVDRLERAGTPGADRAPMLGRPSSCSTASGRRAAARVIAARADVLDAALAALSPAERETLDELVGKALVGMMREPGTTLWTCRLCDTGACGRYTGQCPIGRAAAQRYPDAETS